MWKSLITLANFDFYNTVVLIFKNQHHDGYDPLNTDTTWLWLLQHNRIDLLKPIPHWLWTFKTSNTLVMIFEHQHHTHIEPSTSMPIDTDP